MSRQSFQNQDFYTNSIKSRSKLFTVARRLSYKQRPLRYQEETGVNHSKSLYLSKNRLDVARNQLVSKLSTDSHSRPGSELQSRFRQDGYGPGISMPISIIDRPITEQKRSHNSMDLRNADLSAMFKGHKILVGSSKVNEKAVTPYQERSSSPRFGDPQKRGGTAGPGARSCNVYSTQPSSPKPQSQANRSTILEGFEGHGLNRGEKGTKSYALDYFEPKKDNSTVALMQKRIYENQNLKKNVCIVHNDQNSIEQLKGMRESKAKVLTLQKNSRLATKFKGATNLKQNMQENVRPSTQQKMLDNMKSENNSRNEISKVLDEYKSHVQSVKKVRSHAESQVGISFNSFDPKQGATLRGLSITNMRNSRVGQQKDCLVDDSDDDLTNKELCDWINSLGPKNYLQKAMMQVKQNQGVMKGIKSKENEDAQVQERIDLAHKKQEAKTEAAKGKQVNMIFTRKKQNKEANSGGGLMDAMDRYKLLHDNQKSTYASAVRGASVEQQARRKKAIEKLMAHQEALSKPQSPQVTDRESSEQFERKPDLEQKIRRTADSYREIETDYNAKTTKHKEGFQRVMDVLYEGEQVKSPTFNIVNSMNIEMKRLALQSNTESIHSLMGLNRSQFLSFVEVYTFMKKHGFATTRQDQAQIDAKFSKEFFEIMDEDGKGVSVKELAFPLIALGLASDTGFVKKLVKLLAPVKFIKGNIDEEELTMREFATLFKTDPISDRLLGLVKGELHREKAEAKRLQRLAEVKQQKLASSPVFISKQQQGMSIRSEVSSSPNYLLYQNYNPKLTNQRAMGNKRSRQIRPLVMDSTPGTIHKRQHNVSIIEESHFDDEDSIIYSQQDLTKLVSQSDTLSGEDEDKSSITQILSQPDPRRAQMSRIGQKSSAALLNHQRKMSVFAQNLTPFAFFDNAQNNGLMKPSQPISRSIIISQEEQIGQKRDNQFLGPPSNTTSPFFDLTISHQNKKTPVPKPKPKEPDEPKMFDINEQVGMVRKLWKLIGRDDIERLQAIQKPIRLVSGFFVERQIFADPSSAQGYIHKCQGMEHKQSLEYSDFLNLFLKAIVRDVLQGIARLVENYERPQKKIGSKILKAQSPQQIVLESKSEWESQDMIEVGSGEKEPKTNSEKTLFWKLAEFKRGKLLEKIEKQLEKDNRACKKN